MQDESTIEFRAPDDTELRQFAQVAMQSLSPSFPTDSSAFDAWMLRTRPFAEVRIVRRAGEVAGGAVILPFGQFFGGRTIPTAAVSAVAVAPHHRGAGVAKAMMRALLREARERGLPLSTLYPASHALYRSVGYEFSGQHTTYQIATALLDRHMSDEARAIEVRTIGPGDRALLERLYREYASHRTGFLDRGTWMWNRILEPYRGHAFGYLALRDGEPDGYVAFTHKEEPTVRYDLHLTDFVARSASTTDRLLALLGSHGSMAPHVVFCGEPADPMLFRLEQHDMRVTKSRIDWMVRICDVQKALEARGYPRPLKGALHLRVRDELIEQNDGAWVLEVEGGSGRLRAGGEGTLGVDIGALATMFSGHMSPRALRALGRVQGSEESLDLAQAIFAGPAPSMPDMF